MAFTEPSTEHTWELGQRGDGQKGYRAKMYIVDDCRRCKAEFQNELITAFRKGDVEEGGGVD